MKKTLLSIFTIIGLTASAQIITEANHVPMNGDVVFGTYQCDSTGITPGASGAGQNWNFASLTEHLSTLKTYSTITSVNASYNPADVSVGSGANNTLYYKSATTKLNYFGGDLTIGAFVLNVKYTAPAVVALYPMSLNSSTTSITSGSINATAPIALSGTFNGTCNVIADATGTLTLPGKTFNNVIRIVTSQTISSNLAGGATVNLLVYDYYSPGTSKAPLFSINTSTITSVLGGTSVQTLVTDLTNYNVVGINETQKSSIELSVFPNPASNLINFSTTNTEAAQVIAFDVTGRMIATEALEMGKAKMNLSNFSTGMYLYRLVDKNKQTLAIGKFNVSK